MIRKEAAFYTRSPISRREKKVKSIPTERKGSLYPPIKEEARRQKKTPAMLLLRTALPGEREKTRSQKKKEGRMETHHRGGAESKKKGAIMYKRKGWNTAPCILGKKKGGKFPGQAQMSSRVEKVGRLKKESRNGQRKGRSSLSIAHRRENVPQTKKGKAPDKSPPERALASEKKKKKKEKKIKTEGKEKGGEGDTSSDGFSFARKEVVLEN